MLVGGLTSRRQAYNHIARTDVGIVDDVATLHAAGDGAIYDDGANQVAHIGCLAACGEDADTHIAELGKQLVGAIDDG